MLSEREAQIYHEYFEDEKSMAEVLKHKHQAVSAINPFLRASEKARAMHNIDYLFFFFIIATFQFLVT